MTGYRALRTTAGLVPVAPTLLRVRGSGARAALGRLLPSDLRLRTGSLRTSLILDEAGGVLADVVVGLDDEDWILWVEGLGADAVRDRLPAHGGSVDCADLSQELAVLAIEGPFSWDVLSRFDDPGVLAVPFLSFYRHPDDLLVWRYGRTGELGYQLLVPRPALEGVVARLLELGRPAGLESADVDALRACHRESWSFDVTTPGLRGLDPLELGLRWRLHPRSTAVGTAALAGRSPTRRLCAIVAETPAGIPSGAELRYEGQPVGVVRWTSPFAWGPGVIGAASIDVDLAWSHLSGFEVDGPSTAIAVRTVTPPFVVPRSMWVRPDTHDVSQRDRVPLCVASPGPGEALVVRLPDAASPG